MATLLGMVTAIARGTVVQLGLIAISHKQNRPRKLVNTRVTHVIKVKVPLTLAQHQSDVKIKTFTQKSLGHL